MVLPLGLMPKFVCRVMKKGYHAQDIAGAGLNCTVEGFLKEKIARYQTLSVFLKPA